MKIRAFVVVILAQQYWHLFTPWFSMYFTYSKNLSIKVPPKFENYMKLFRTFKGTISKYPNIKRKTTPFPASRLYSSLSMELKLLINHYWTPCMSHRDNHGDWLFLLNSFIYCMKTFRLFLNIIRKILGKPPSEGGTKKWFFQIQFVKHLKRKLNSEDEPCISKIEWIMAIFVGWGVTKKSPCDMLIYWHILLKILKKMLEACAQHVILGYNWI